MKKLILLFLSLFSVAAYAQQIPDFGIDQVRVGMSDQNIVAEIKPLGSKPSIAPDKIYYWFSSNTIKQTQGGYSGHLLNGQYHEFYLNKNLKEQGAFNKGLKNGLWKSWSENGSLAQQIIWKNGLKNGEFELYDEKGLLKKKGSYKNDVLVPEKQASSHFWNRLPLFKKKNKQAELPNDN